MLAKGLRVHLLALLNTFHLTAHTLQFVLFLPLTSLATKQYVVMYLYIATVVLNLHIILTT